jgi:hypothetical protein
MTTRTVVTRTALTFAALSLVLTACGSDGDSSAKSEAKPSTSTSTRPAVDAAYEEYCDGAWDLFEQDSFPKPAQIQVLVDAAPDAIAAPIGVAGPALIAAGTDPVAQMNAFGADDVEAAIAQINEWEKENCKIPHEPDEAGPGATREIDPAATRRDVKLMEYEFDFDEPVTAGRTSFVATNAGAQAHFMLLVRLADGVTLEDALKSEEGKGIEAQWSSSIVAAGGADEEALTVDLEPGTYGMACFIPDPDGTPHAMKGMARQFTVS